MSFFKKYFSGSENQNDATSKMSWNNLTDLGQLNHYTFKW
jgi:hypothetical protein